MQQSFPCPKCSTQIPVGQKFCGTCGEQFDYKCGHCGAAVKTSSGFCINCGKKLPPQTKLPTEFSAKRVMRTGQREKAVQKESIPPPKSQVGRYLILIAIIIFIAAILYAISTGAQGEQTNWFGCSFTFGGQSPPSTPPETEAQPTPEPAVDSPQYTTDQVIAAARNQSPDCRLSTRRTG